MVIDALTACLFCGDELTETTRSREHVFPRWLQDRYGIANQEMTLANGTAVRYAQLRVPACVECNNVHAGQLEHRVANGTASLQDKWLWMLKIQLGLYYWESGRPASQDRRDPKSNQPIVPVDLVDITYFQSLFSALKGAGATFDPSPCGTLLCFAHRTSGFDYADRLFAHPRVRENVYSAGMIVFDDAVWIALFDDGRRVADHLLDEAVMHAQVVAGRDPREFLPEVMYTRSRMVWYPKLLVGTGADGHTDEVKTLPTMGLPQMLPFDADELATFYRVPAQD